MENEKKIEEKWVIRLTMPSGAKFVVSSFEGKFAMEPINDGKFKNAMSWNTAMDAKVWFKKYREEVGDEEFAKLWSLRPETVKVRLQA